MTDLLIRNVPEDVLVQIDAHARRLGLSRSEFLRRSLAQVARGSGYGVGAHDLRMFEERFRDLADATEMDEAWR